MTAKLLFTKTETLYRELRHTIEDSESGSTSDTIAMCEHILMETDTAIRSLKAMVATAEMSSAAHEVHFFKNLKPLFVAEFIYWSKILGIEAAKPNAGQQILKEYYELELRELKTFVDQHADFYEYYRRKATYLDEKYFVRNQTDFKMTTDAQLYSYDTTFSTSHDALVAQILAHDRLEQYLLQSIYGIEGYFYDKFTNKSPITWTGSKSALIELLYALHVSNSFNGGNVDFSETVRLIEKSFNIELGNFYKTLHEVRNRKTGQAKFLESLASRLVAKFEEEAG